MAFKQFTDCYVRVKAGDMTAGNAVSAEVNNTIDFDTTGCISPSIDVDVVTLGASKTIAFKLQHRDLTTGTYVDVPAGLATDCDPADTISSTGLQQYFYAGELRYVRLVLISRAANPASTVRATYVRHNLLEKPNSASG